MKLIILLISLFASQMLFAGKKETLIDRINNADSIPVYINRGKVSPGTYLGSSNNPTLLKHELNQKYINGQVPASVDSMQPSIVSNLNQVFETTKFYAATTGNEEEIKKIISSGKHEFFIVAHFHATYNYNIHRKSNRSRDSVLHSPMEHHFYCSVQFWEYLENKGKSKKMEASNSAVVSQFTQHGYTRNADALMKSEDPVKHIPKLEESILPRLQETGEKQKAKHEKALKKRKK